MFEPNLVKIYDGADFCSDDCCCPRIVENRETGIVTLSDPAKPASGSFTMTRDEYNTMVNNLQPIS